MGQWTEQFGAVPRTARRDLRGLLHGNALMRLDAVHRLIDSGSALIGPLFFAHMPDADPLINRTMLEALARRSRAETADAALRLWLDGGPGDKPTAEVVLLNEVQKRIDRAIAGGALHAKTSVYRLLADLGSRAPQRSRAAFYELQALRDRCLLPALDGLLGWVRADQARRVLRLMSQLHGPWTREAAERLIQRGRTDEHRLAGIDHMLGCGRRWRVHLGRVAVSRDADDPVGHVIIDRLIERDFAACERDCLASLRDDLPYADTTAVCLLGRFASRLRTTRHGAADDRLKRCLGALVMTLHDPAPTRRIAAIHALAELGLHKLLPSRFNDADAAVRHAAVSACLHATATLTDNTCCDVVNITDAAPATLHGHMIGLLASGDPAMRGLACRWLGERGDWWDAKRVRPLRADECEAVRQDAATALSRLRLKDPRERAKLRNKLKSTRAECRQSAVVELAKSSAEQDIEAVVAMVDDADPRVQHGVLCALAEHQPERADAAAARLLLHPTAALARKALELLAKPSGMESLIQRVRAALPEARDAGGIELVAWLIERRPSEKAQALRVALASRCPKLRCYAIRELAAIRPAKDSAWLEPLLADREPLVRHAALRVLRAGDAGLALRHCERLMRDPTPEVRGLMLKLIDEHGGHAQRLLGLRAVRDPEAVVRAEAIAVIADLDDPRVPGELISAMSDADGTVAQHARCVCKREALRPRSAREFSSEQWTKLVDDRLGQIKQLHAWARIVGRELLGRPIQVHRALEGLGFTFPPKHRGAPVEVYLNDLPIASGHEHGLDVMKGLALHELGHHLYDIGIRGSRCCRGRARAAGVGGIYDLLTDERLERGLRSRRPAWGVYFDRLASYAFAREDNPIALCDYAKLLGVSVQTLESELLAGKRPGRRMADDTVMLGYGDMLRIPGLMPRHHAFLVCLRCGFDPRLHDDPAVAEAVALVPDNLKDLGSRALLELAERIAGLIGRESDAQRHLREMRRRFKASRRLIDRLEKWVRKQVKHCGATPPRGRGATGPRRRRIPARAARSSRLSSASRCRSTRTAMRTWCVRSARTSAGCAARSSAWAESTTSSTPAAGATAWTWAQRGAPPSARAPTCSSAGKTPTARTRTSAC